MQHKVIVCDMDNDNLKTKVNFNVSFLNMLFSEANIVTNNTKNMCMLAYTQEEEKFRIVARNTVGNMS